MKKILLEKKENSNVKKAKVVAIVGPTASGKTDYSIDYALKNNGEIISADSRLIYKDFNITCAKPTIKEMRNIPHHMIDILTPDREYSAGLYAKEARDCIYKIIKLGKTPIIAGGTGLYFRLLLENYTPPLGEPNYEYRKYLNQKETAELYKTLKSVDIVGAASIDGNDRKKIIRALEIIKTTGQPLNRARGIKPESEFEVEWIGLNLPRKDLYERINNRVDLMYTNGMLEETKYLLKKYGRTSTITSTIGYQEMIMYLDGILTLEEALERLKQNTRRYAKRQLTWFRRNKNIRWNVYPETLSK